MLIKFKCTNGSKDYVNFLCFLLCVSVLKKNACVTEMYELTLQSNHGLSCKCIFRIFLKGGLCKSVKNIQKK